MALLYAICFHRRVSFFSLRFPLHPILLEAKLADRERFIRVPQERHSVVLLAFLSAKSRMQ